MPTAFTECVQRAAAYVAARARGDLDAAEAMLASFDNDNQRTLAFASLAELAVGLVAAHDDEPTDVIASRLALSIAALRSDEPY
jgi:phytoene/squalene synthetase